MFDIAWDCEPCIQEEEHYMRLLTLDLDDPAIEEKLRILLEQREASLAAQG